MRKFLPLITALPFLTAVLFHTPSYALYFGEDSRLSNDAIAAATAYIAVGQVVCKLKGLDWEQQGTGTLTSDGIVITAGHIFLNPNGTLFTAPETCVFVMFDAQNKIYKILKAKRAKVLTQQFERIPERDFGFLDLGPQAAETTPNVLRATTRFLAIPGRTLHAIGYSMDISDTNIRRKVTFTIGHKGSKSRYKNHENIFYHDGDVGPASSGAPILDSLTGKVIGIHLGGYGGVTYDENTSFNYGALFSREIAIDYEIFLSQRAIFHTRY
jgi:V8-like Glu-specific endopeptidase